MLTKTIDLENIEVPADPRRVELRQTSNGEIELTALLPDVDLAGNPLSGQVRIVAELVGHEDSASVAEVGRPGSEVRMYLPIPHDLSDRLVSGEVVRAEVHLRTERFQRQSRLTLQELNA